MKAFIASGYSPQVAARLTLTDRAAVGRLSGSPHTAASLEELASSLPASLTDFQDAGANDPLDHLLARYGVEVVVVAVVLPLLREIGDCWARADAGQPRRRFPRAVALGSARAVVAPHVAVKEQTRCSPEDSIG